MLLDFAVATDQILKTLKSSGYTVRLVHKNNKRSTHLVDSIISRWCADNKTSGVKLVIVYTISHQKVITHQSGSTKLLHTNGDVYRTLSIKCRCRDERGRFPLRDLQYGYLHLEDSSVYYPSPINSSPRTPQEYVDKLCDELKNVTGVTVKEPIVTSMAEMGPPLKFDKPGYDEVFGFNNVPLVGMRCVYYRCRVMKMVAILPNLKLDTISLTSPNVEPWFLIAGESVDKKSKANVEIVVREIDGELVYYPVRSYRITNDYQPLGTLIDFKAFTELDRFIIDKAIGKFLKTL